jgi:hypothetical protein
LEFYSKTPPLGFDVSTLAKRKEHIISGNLAKVDQRPAIVRISHIVDHWFDWVRRAGMVKRKTPSVAVRQEIPADAMGLLHVPIKKTLTGLNDIG